MTRIRKNYMHTACNVLPCLISRSLILQFCFCISFFSDNKKKIGLCSSFSMVTFPVLFLPIHSVRIVCKSFSLVVQLIRITVKMNSWKILLRRIMEILYFYVFYRYKVSYKRETGECKLEISMTFADDAGEYTIIVRNKYGEASATVSLLEEGTL